MENKIKIFIKEPGGVPQEIEVENTLEALQELVEGDIETCTITNDMVIICNEEGKLFGLEDNCMICGERFVGTILFAGVDGEEFTDMPIDLERFAEMFPDLFEEEI